MLHVVESRKTLKGVAEDVETTLDRIMAEAAR